MMMLTVLLAATPLSLDEVKAAARQSLDAIRAELALTRAGLDRKDARSVIFPQVNLSLGVSELLAGPQRRFTTAPQLQPDGSLTFVQRPVDLPPFAQGNLQLGLTVNQLLYDGGRWWNQLARTGAMEEAAKGQLAEQQAASELEATRRFYELLRAQLVLSELKHQVARSAELLERARGLFEAGRAQRRDALDAEVNLGNDRIAVLRQQQHVEAAQASLLQWLARPPADVEAQEPATFAAPARAPSLTPAQLLLAARQRRPLFSVLAAQGRGGRLAVEVARADFLPRVTANLGYGRSAPSGELFVDPSRQHSLTLGASLSWDLFNGLQTESMVERASAQLTELERQQAQTLLELESELVRATKALAAQHDIHRIAEQNRGLAEASFSLEQQRFAAGASTSLSVRDAQQRALAAQLTALQTRVDVEVARAALERLAGAALVELEQKP